MRKLFPISVLASLLAVPTAPASAGDRSLDAVPSLVALPRVSTVPGEKELSDLPSLRAAAPSSAASEEARPDNDPSLISSPVFSDPLDTHEARGRLQAAVRRAKRDAALEDERAAEPPPSAGAAPATAVPSELQQIAACESGGDPQAVGGGGAYRGKYQFSPSTWQAVGGSGDPAAAPEAEQDRRAAMLYARSGPSQWPNCAG